MSATNSQSLVDELARAYRGDDDEIEGMGPRDLAEVAGLPTFPTRRLAGILQRELAASGPIPAGRVTELAGANPQADLDELAPFLETNAAGATTTVMGLSTDPTAHEFHVHGRALYTWCAFDPLVFAAAHGWTGWLRTCCPATNAFIEAKVTPGGVESVIPREAVIVLVGPEAETPTCVTGADDVRTAFCAHMNLYRSPQAATQAVGDEPGLPVLGLADASRLGHELAGRMGLTPPE